MAIAPQNNAEILREVDDQLRRDQIVRLGKRWGLVAIGVIVAGLLALGGWLWWRAERQEAVGLEGEAMASAITKLESGNTRGAEPQFKALTTSKADGYRVAARIALADGLLSKNDTKGAASAYAAIAADASVAQPFRDLALIRQTTAEFDTLKPEIVVSRLRGLTVAGNPWLGSAGEMVAVAYLRQGKRDLAGATFGAMVKDKGVPDSIRSRAVQMAGVLGVEVELPDAGAAGGGGAAVAGEARN